MRFAFRYVSWVLGRPRLFALAALVACRTPNAPPSAHPAAPEAANKEIVVGDTVPKFSAPDLDGRPTSIETGKVYVVGFLATWSAPDQKSIPKLEEMYQRHRAKGLEVLAISIDDDEGKKYVRAFFRDNGGTFPVVHDAGHRISTTFYVPCSPTYYVVDRSGIVRVRHCGYRDGSVDEIEREVMKHLAR